MGSRGQVLQTLRAPGVQPVSSLETKQKLNFALSLTFLAFQRLGPAHLLKQQTQNNQSTEILISCGLTSEAL